MIFHPLILALIVASGLTSFLVLYASVFGAQILGRWDLRSGSEAQLGLERKTYLISTLLAFVFTFELLSLFLFIFTADRLHTFFVGAMCAAGTLHVNAFGYPALLLKAINFVLAGTWLILNAADIRGYDYPLTKKKYAYLLALAPLILAETALQTAFFLKMKPDITTSCCGSLFGASGGSVAADLASLPVAPMKAVFGLSLLLTLASGFYFLLKGRGGSLFAALSGVNLIVSLLAILSFISIYFYELPSHHCPFCILQKEYGFLGYPIYLAVLGGGICGLGVGVLNPFRKVTSLAAVMPSLQRKLALAAVISLLVFAALVIHRLAVSNLNLP
ncbi:MAG: hypothetical protein A2W03_04600 [Candidatus Aminicenantes bacterium RBG_16_63_16]|nr:MAG: hypothetical protein A2W03_04600 [Candidatus Aminicenantes bacterium RBG_16_63_16]